MPKAERLLWRQPPYAAVDEDSSEREESIQEDSGTTRYSWIEYTIFMLLGIAMLWLWNMFLAAGSYFQQRFRADKSILSSFQATELSVATVANLGVVLVLTKLQTNASYTRRIAASLCINIITAILLAMFTQVFLDISPGTYFSFLVMMVFASSLATGFMQNGSYALAAGSGRQEYMQAVMTGQGIAGVLPPAAQIVSVLLTGDVGDNTDQQSSTSALIYFLTAAGVSSATLAAFYYLVHRPTGSSVKPPEGLLVGTVDVDEPEEATPVKGIEFSAKSVSVYYLARKLFTPAAAIFLTFGASMVFPVFTQEIVSTNPDRGALFRKACFIPLAFLMWNTGDLLGRLIPLQRRLSLANSPKILLLFSLLRFIFIPLYLLCNIQDDESSSITVSSIFRSDVFYLLLVQFPFGLSNGYVGSCCMMGASNFVEEEEREAAGGFMGLVLVAGLAVGSFCSFFVGGGD